MERHAATFAVPGGPLDATAGRDQYGRPLDAGKWYVTVGGEAGAACCAAGPFDSEAEAGMWATLPEGTRIVLAADVERYPHFIVPAGRTGSVVERSASLVLVAMDEPFEGGEDWDHEIQFCDDCWDLTCMRVLGADRDTGD